MTKSVVYQAETNVPSVILLARVVAIVTTIGIGVAGFVLSFAALWDLAIKAGQPPRLAWLWPVIIDGTIVQSTVAIVALAPYPDIGRHRRFFWAVLTGAASISISGNGFHAWINAGPLPALVAAAIAAVAPVSLLAATHGLAILARTSAHSEAHDYGSIDQRFSNSVAPQRRNEYLSTHHWADSAESEQTVSQGVSEERWWEVAEQVCAADPTGQRDPQVVARILHLKYEAGWSHRRIGRDVDTHHSTVGRILDAADKARRPSEAVSS
ncbi:MULTISPECIES: DUF2637 domain-containing protein [unclassified Nocardia]|uniref:DUF2637 domain-containing protein n=1 Tax=unclassified Nocardia TaxID=2637762 RepID=UPI001CE43FF2|nr:MULTISPECIES: DUF2637 domain-containing protein [unclassified Nocardia]